MQNGGNPLALTDDSFSPLHFASKHGSEKCVGLLLDAVRRMNDTKTSEQKRKTEEENFQEILTGKDDRGHYLIDKAFDGGHDKEAKQRIKQEAKKMTEPTDKRKAKQKPEKEAKQETEKKDKHKSEKKDKQIADEKNKQEAEKDKHQAEKVNQKPEKKEKHKTENNDKQKAEKKGKQKAGKEAKEKGTQETRKMDKKKAKEMAKNKEIAKNLAFRYEVLKAVIESSWCKVAFDARICSKYQHVSTGSEVYCNSFTLLVEKYPELACQAMDKHISLHISPLDKQPHEQMHQYSVESNSSQLRKDNSNNIAPLTAGKQELHNYSPFEFIHYRAQEDTNGEGVAIAAPNNKNAKTWYSDHPLQKAVGSRDEDHSRVLRHKLTLSWLLNKYQYSRWFLYGYLFIDIITAVVVALLLSMTWNSQRLQAAFSGATRSQVSQAFADTRSSDRDMRAAVSAVMLIADTDASCSSWGNGWNASDDMEVLSAAWNRSVCAVHQLQRHSPGVIVLESLTLLLLIVHAFLEWKFLIKISHSTWDLHRLSRMLRFVSLGLLLLGFSLCDFILGCRQALVWHLEVLAVLLTCIHVVLTLSKFPRFTGFLPDDRKLILHFMEGLIPIILFLIAFAWSFHCLLMDNASFSSMPYSFVNTTTLMLGDFAYDDTFANETHPVVNQILVNLLFLVFIVCIGGILLNYIFNSPMEKLTELRKEDQLKRAIAYLRIHLLIDECRPSLRKKYRCASKIYEGEDLTRLNVSYDMFKEGHKKTSDDGPQLKELAAEMAKLR
ncbi:hypothetical protein HAZT_HAZT005019 [Hyalella azteca]|uniref:non-specific serine/threonine protein kinase n=1 Tax=Hyalella azteca TaxID=294128 RepID=A0A6A0H1N9_HYAAZ|nr:hypothetical protein HAZT_HAZT005019 [Hyalella azteca]